MRTLVISSCTSKKARMPKDKLVKKDFLNPKLLKKKKMELESFSLNAIEMYTGRQHIRLKEGVDILRKKYGKKIVDVKIISAGYGLIDENKSIIPYEVTFSNMRSKELDEWAKNLQIKEDLEMSINNYDLIIFLLGTKYLRSLRLPINNLRANQRLVFLASKTSKTYIPPDDSYYFLEVGQRDASSFSCGLIELKGYLFKLFAQEVKDRSENLLDNVYQDPNLLLEVLSKYRKNKEQMLLFEKIQKHEGEKSNGYYSA